MPISNHAFGAIEASVYAPEIFAQGLPGAQRQVHDDKSERAVAEGAALLLSLEGIGLSFGGVVALADVDLSVRPGEIRAIIGPNGAGKSSLINVISGVYRADRGNV
ncbi:ATP-binding cassette domain-containing protein, partial [Bradyrhizobium sp. Arg314]